MTASSGFGAAVRARRATLLAPALLGAWALVAPYGARAQDGGMRSVFATGAGNRALSMGGAYGALADDASAALWNPGGLGLVTQGEIQVSQAALHDAGFRETFAGIVYPRWRWGVASLTLRQFGASGIDGRDARNLPTQVDGQSRETEVGIGYGSAVGEAWSLGATAKLRRQELAGRSGSGVGADLGLKLRAGGLTWAPPWTRGVSVGLGVTNAVEPAIRLDRENVPDPAAMRLGLAWQGAAGAVGSMVASLDVEKARGVSGGLHAGLEVTPMPMFALRGGLDDGVVTAGTGLRWGAAAVDYMFENGPIGPSHRAGLTWRFGLTVDESRVASERADEERLQARLADAERTRQAERVATLRARAADAHRAGHEDDALAAIATLRALEVTAGLDSLEAAVWAARGRRLHQAGDLAAGLVAYGRAQALAPADSATAQALDRVRGESDARAARSAEIRRRFAAALDAFSADDLARARSAFAGILAISPADSEARAMLKRVESAVGQRTASLLRQAGTLLQAGLLTEASVLVDRVRALDPGARGLPEIEATLVARQHALAAEKAARLAAERAREAEKAHARTEPVKPAGPPPLTPQQQRELADYYRRGIAALERGRSDEAMRYWELVRSIRPGYERVDEFLEREYRTRGMEAFAAGRLEEAVRLWEAALRVDPSDLRTLGYLARAHEQLARARAISADSP